MIYLSQLLGNPVLDSDGEKIGTVSDLGIATGEIFPRVTSLAFMGPGRTPFMISWRKYVDDFDDDEVHLKVPATDIRFSYLQPDEVLLARDILNKQIVDTRGMRVVRVNDLKLSDTSSSQLRLLGAEVGIRGILRTLAPGLERATLKVARVFGKSIPERIIAWNYMDLVERDLSNVKLSVSHQTLDDMHPADVADIIERLDPRLRGQVFAQLDDEQRAETMAEFDDDQMAATLVGDMPEADASRMLSEMDPDDAAELVAELGQDRAEKLLRLMGIKEQRAIRQLLGYPEDTAGRIMTQEFVQLPEDAKVADAIQALRDLDEDFETVHYIYLHDDERRLSGVVSLNNLIVATEGTTLHDIAFTDIVSCEPDEDQEDVAEDIAKYNLLAMPVVDENKHLLGIVTVDDALDVMDEEHEEDLQIAGASTNDESGTPHDLAWLVRSEMWVLVWLVGIGIMGMADPAHSMGTSIALAALALPVAIVSAGDAITYVTNFFIAYDEDDEDAPSMLGFALKGLGMGLLLAMLVLLIASGINVTLFSSEPQMQSYAFASFQAAAATIVVSALLEPLWLHILRRRDAQNLETSGTSLSALAMVIALAVYLVAVAVLTGGVVL